MTGTTIMSTAKSARVVYRSPAEHHMVVIPFASNLVRIVEVPR